MKDLLPEEYHAIPEYYKKPRHCLYCEETYREYENVGQLRCLLHPGVRRLVGNTYSYSCCGRQQQGGGCHKADHRDTLLVTDDEAQRLAQLTTGALIAVPRDLFRHGIVPPHRDHVVLSVERRGDVSTGSLNFMGGRIAFSAADLHQALVDSVATSPFLKSLVTRLNEKQGLRADVTRHVDQRWRDELVKRDESETELKSLFIPFVVVRRVAPVY